MLYIQNTFNISVDSDIVLNLIATILFLSDLNCDILKLKIDQNKCPK